jgi:SWI/SNF-related matrix-associated actin-dependent regulator of chromatin subfamily A3
MGLGKTISCVSLIAATLNSARAFAASPLDVCPRPPPRQEVPDLTAAHFAGSVWGMPDVSNPCSKGKAKGTREQDRLEAEYIRVSRIKVKSRATLIICPLSTVSNWEDQFREHWHGGVTIVGGTCYPLGSNSQSSSTNSTERSPFHVYVYHGNARRPEPWFLANFDAVITTYATLASEFSKQNRSILSADLDDDDDEASSDSGGVDFDERGNPVLRLPKPKKCGMKRKKSALLANVTVEATSPLQSIHWFRVVLDEAQ